MKSYFSQWDFDNCVPKCKMEEMHPETMKKLNKAREIAGIPFIINSAYRTVEHEIKQGRAGTSSHISGRAVDVRAVQSRTKFIVVDALIKAGFTRIGVHNGFIHVDDDPSKDPRVLWLY